MNVFQTILAMGHDEDFDPKPGPLHFPTKFSPGSVEKIEVLRQRVELGLPLWHEKDEGVCSVVGTGEKKKGYDYPVRAKVPSGRGKGLID